MNVEEVLEKLTSRKVYGISVAKNFEKICELINPHIPDEFTLSQRFGTRCRVLKNTGSEYDSVEVTAYVAIVNGEFGLYETSRTPINVSEIKHIDWGKVKEGVNEVFHEITEMDNFEAPDMELKEIVKALEAHKIS